jgi:hypothetical protein
MNHICEEQVRKFKDAWNRLEEMGINPQKLHKEMRELALAGRLTKEHLTAYFDLLRARSDVIRCALRYVLGLD